jgi:hypothetical protein
MKRRTLKERAEAWQKKAYPHNQGPHWKCPGCAALMAYLAGYRAAKREGRK